MARFVVVVFSFCVSVAVGCARSGDVAAVADSSGGASVDEAPPPPVVRDDASSLLFSFVDAGGRIVSVPLVSAVPEAARKRVLVVDLARTPEQRQAHRYAYFADLSAKDAAGNYPVVVVSRYDAARKDDGVLAPVADGRVVVYSAAWCGYCKLTKKWLKERGTPFVERDVEKTKGAAQELAAKLEAAHIPGGGIPVTDVGGSLVVGYDIPALEKLLPK